MVSPATPKAPPTVSPALPRPYPKAPPKSRNVSPGYAGGGCNVGAGWKPGGGGGSTRLAGGKLGTGAANPSHCSGPTGGSMGGSGTGDGAGKSDRYVLESLGTGKKSLGVVSIAIVIFIFLTQETQPWILYFRHLAYRTARDSKPM